MLQTDWTAGTQVRTRLDPGRLDRLRRAIDPVLVLEMLHRHWSYPRRHNLNLVSCDVLRMHPRGEEFVICYEIQMKGPDGPVKVELFGELVPHSTELHCREAIARLRKRRRRQVPRSGPIEWISAVPDLHLVIRFTGLDEKIPGLIFLREPDRLLPILSESTVPPWLRLGDIRATLLSHRLGKRCVARFNFAELDIRSGTKARNAVIAKMLRANSARGRSLLSTLRSLRNVGFDERSEVRVPRPIAYLEDWDVALMHEAPGEPLATLPDCALLKASALAGRAMAKLHQCEHLAPRRHGVVDELELLTNWVVMASGAFPNLEEPLRKTYESVRSNLVDLRKADLKLIHRDFHEKQVLVDHETTTLIDFETLSLGDPALDAGNFLAHLYLLELQRGEDFSELRAAFIDSYLRSTAVDIRPRLEPYVNAARLRLACIYAFSSAWHCLSEPLLDGQGLGLKC